MPVKDLHHHSWHPTPVLLPGKSHGWRSLVGCSPWGREESDTTERLPFHFHALEKEMATHSSVLAWRIPGMAEPGGLPSLRSHRVGQDWCDLAAAAAVTSWRRRCSSNSKESACEAGDQDSIPELGSSSGEGNGNPLQYSCLENSMDREAWQATVHGVTKTEWLTQSNCYLSSTFFFFCTLFIKD